MRVVSEVAICYYFQIDMAWAVESYPSLGQVYCLHCIGRHYERLRSCPQWQLAVGTPRSKAVEHLGEEVTVGRRAGEVANEVSGPDTGCTCKDALTS